MSAYQYTQVALTWAVLEDTTNAQQLVITGTLDSFAYRAQLLGKVLE